jgi:hypothetical protein
MLERSGRYRLWSVLLLVFIMSCDSQQQQNDFATDASRPAEGFTSTTETGEILSEDEDDWRTAPFYFGKIRVSPVYPNPAGADFVTVPVTVLQFDTVLGGLTLRAYDASLSSLILLDRIVDISGPGGYVMRFSPAVIGRSGLVRVFIFDSGNEIVSYGDVMIGS